MEKYLHIKYLWLLLIGLFTLTISSCDDPLTGGMDPVMDAILDDSQNADSIVSMSDFQPCLTIDQSLTTSRNKNVPVFDLVFNAVGYIGKEWTASDTVDPNDTGFLSDVVITVTFLDGTSEERALVEQIAPEWGKHGAFLRFKFVESGVSDIRVGFDPNGGHRSFIGTDAKLGSKEWPRGGKTMNLALRGARYPERPILHEFGHALGLAHEHQNPAITSTIRWDETAVINHFELKHGWTKEKTEHNILTPLSRNQSNFTRFDPESIMVYPIPNEWTIGDFETGYNLTLSATDKSFIRSTLYRGRPPDPLRPTETPPGMVLIPAGEFQMGSNSGSFDEKPVHSVYVDAFYMDKYEVTNAQYAAFLNAKGKHTESGKTWLYIGRGSVRIEYVAGVYRVKGGYENHPVTHVSWYGAVAYSKWKGKRLPTEAEWEKAARGNLSGLTYPWGNSIDRNKANYNGHINGHINDTTAAVGTYTANGYGLYDMAGNVWEWCLDEHNSGFYAVSPSYNPLSGANSIRWILDNYTGVNSSRVLRGGSWNNSARLVRVTYRNRTDPTTTSTGNGFRCARTVSP